MKIPFVDLNAQYKTIQSEIDEVISNVMRETAFVGGTGNKYIRQFEADFCNYLNVKHTISCANGTDSIEILLEAYGVSKGDEVIVPAVSWISTSEAVGRTGATPVFVDIVKDTMLMDVEKIEKMITPKTKAIIPVHLYGNAVDMEYVMKLAGKHNLIVIEDCAQAHGSKFSGKLVGTFGHAASFSFYPGKNLGAYGDAGCMTTDTEEISLKCRMIANHGQLEKHKHMMEGRNSRMDGLHAAVLSVKLKHLDKWNASRNEKAKKYFDKITSKSITLPVTNKTAYHVYHLFVIKSDKRDELKQEFEENTIETAIHYPVALPFLDAYKKFNFAPDDFPVAWTETKKILSIPMFPELSDEQIDSVVSVLNKIN